LFFNDLVYPVSQPAGAEKFTEKFQTDRKEISLQDYGREGRNYNNRRLIKAC
jgi:hypothetical protein